MKRVLLALTITFAIIACGEVASSSASNIPNDSYGKGGRYHKIDYFEIENWGMNHVTVLCDTYTGHLIYLMSVDRGGGAAVDSNTDCRQ